jgi:hypothetical protein
MDLKKEELLNINGGGISGTLLNSIIRGINVLLDLGRSLGTAIRRLGSNSICPL